MKTNPLIDWTKIIINTYILHIYIYLHLAFTWMWMQLYSLSSRYCDIDIGIHVSNCWGSGHVFVWILFQDSQRPNRVAAEWVNTADSSRAFREFPLFVRTGTAMSSGMPSTQLKPQTGSLPRLCSMVAAVRLSPWTSGSSYRNLKAKKTRLARET